MSDDKIFRLLKLLAMLQTGRTNVKTLVTEFNVHPRTVLRDINVLKRGGFVINFDRELKRYVVRNSTMLPELQLTLDATRRLKRRWFHRFSRYCIRSERNQLVDSWLRERGRSPPSVSSV